MSFVERYLKRPHLVTSFVLLAAVVGLVGYSRMPVNLFPDSERPQIAVVTVVPGAPSEDVEAEISRLIEKELAGIEEVRRVTSITKDEVSTVRPSSSTRRVSTRRPPTWPTHLAEDPGAPARDRAAADALQDLVGDAPDRHARPPSEAGIDA